MLKFNILNAEKMRKLLITFLCLIFHSICIGQSFNLSDPSQLDSFISLQKSQTEGPELGSKFPEFDYLDLNGATLKSIDLQDKLVVINIWFVGCKGCKQEENNLRKLTQEFSDNEEIVFLSFSMSSPQKIERYYAKNEDFGYQTSSVERKWVESNFSIRTSPTHLVVKDGILVEKITAAIFNPQLLDWFRDRIYYFLE